MKPFYKTIVFCAIYCSVLCLDTACAQWLKKQHKTVQNTKKPSSKQPDNDPTECSEENPEHLLLTYNPKTHIQLLLNGSTDTVPVLDFRNNISAMYNGKTGAAFAFNYATGEGVFIPAGTSDMTWSSSRTSFEDYFSDLPPQKGLYRYGQTHGIRFDPTTVTEQLSDEMLKVLEPLSSEYSAKCDALAIILQISKTTSDYFYTSLRGYAEVMGSVDDSPFRGDLKWLFGFYQGLGVFFGEIDGGMEILARKGIKLSLAQLLTEESGFHIIIYLLKELEPHFDIGEILGSTLNAPDRFFPIVDKLGGQLGYGFDGFVHGISEIVAFIGDANSLQNVEIVLQEFCTNPKTNVTAVKEQWEKSLKDVLETIEELKLEKSLDGLSELLNGLLYGKWQHKGVDVGNILDIVIHGDENCVTEVISLLKLVDEIRS